MSNLAYKDRELLDPKTGELLTVEQIALEYIKETYHEEEKKKEKIKNYLKLKKSKDELHQTLNKECGSFYFSSYGKILKEEYIFRFIHLCTYMNYDNILVFGNSKDNEIKKATKKDLKEILNLSKPQFYETINNFIDKGLIEITDDGIIVDRKVCIRGSISKDVNIQEGLVRMFDDAIQELYKNSSPKEHKKIGLLIKLLPYVNKETNIICSNPEEVNVELVKPLSQKEMLGILNITKPTAISLVNIKILNGKEGAFIKASNPFHKNFYVINPRFMNKIGNTKSFEEALYLFKAGSKKN